MPLRTCLILLLWITCHMAPAQNSALVVDEADKEMGALDNIYKISTGYVLQNTLPKNLYLLRADAQKGITIRAAKKTLKPGDTSLITVEFIPQSTGRFHEAIQLVTSADGQPYVLSLSGTIKSIKTDDKTACFYFKRPNTAGVKTTDPIVVTEPSRPRDVSNRMPDHSSEPKATPTATAISTTSKPPAAAPTPTASSKTLDPNLYKPNNIVFVVDVSSSMKDSLKLPVMQASLHTLIEALRPEDHVTFITYADSVKLLMENLSGSDRPGLEAIVDKLKARGPTKGNKAILFGLEVALKHYLGNGNNQIILATDGKFRFTEEDQQKFLTRQGSQKVILSTVAFGHDKDALANLQNIAKTGNGSFIHIKNRAKAKEALLNEIKDKSLVR